MTATEYFAMTNDQQEDYVASIRPRYDDMDDIDSEGNPI